MTHRPRPSRIVTVQIGIGMISCILVLAASCALTRGTDAKPAAVDKSTPVLLGINMAGDWHAMKTGKDFYEYESWYRAMKDMGAQFVDYNYMWSDYIKPIKDNEQQAEERLKRFDRLMSEHGMKYVMNNELSNWKPKLEFTPGVNIFDHPDGTHRWDFSMKWMDLILPPTRPGPPAFIGINYDEADHMILYNNGFSDTGTTYSMPYLVNTTGMNMDEAFDKLTAKLRDIRVNHYQNRMPLFAEFGFPDMFPIFARAGWTVAPKMLKENVGSTSLCAALGAAIEYADEGVDLYVLNDLWNMPAFPGHSPEGLRSGLLMSYWLGASRIYVENMDYGDCPVRHPKASPKGSLVNWLDADHYELTNHGRVVQDFFKKYIPAHPRTVRWQDYQPRVAIVRLPDGAWGQKGTWYRDQLLGNNKHPMDEISAEWLHVWPILTHGTVKDGANCVQNSKIYPEWKRDPFMPVDSVAVFDHYVHGPVLDSVECFVVCGHALSKETFEDISQRVKSGKATCIIARRLYNLYAKGTLPGNWLVVDSFTDPSIAQKLKPHLGPTDVARFRFKDQTIEFRRGKAEDSMTVTQVAGKAGSDLK